MISRAASLILFVLLAAQGALAILQVPGSPPGPDEHYYVSKARYIYENARLPKARPADLAAEAGAPGTSDWRPPGYPLFVALVSGGEFDIGPLRRRVAITQAAAAVAAVIFAWRLILPRLSTRRRLVAAIILGVAPWPFAFATHIITDSLNASVAFFGLGLLVLWSAAERPRLCMLFAGALLCASTLLLRPEMIAVAPIPALAALLIRRRSDGFVARNWLAAGTAMLIVVTGQFAYRVYFTGKPAPTLFGGLHIYNRGAFAWANSWIGTEHEAYDFVYGLGYGARTRPLPDRAFASAEERSRVEQLRSLVRSHGYSPAIDEQFGQLALERKREHWFSAVVLPRLWHTVHLWANTETNDQLLMLLGTGPRALSRGVLAVLLLGKAVLLALFLRRLIGRPDVLTAIMGSLVVSRTLLMGLVLNWMVNRYMVVAWLPLLVVALTPHDESR